MKKLKVVTVVGTRPEIIRLSRVITKLDLYCEHSLVHTGQNYDYELNQIFFDDLNIRKPDYFLNAAGKTSAETIGQIIISIDQVLADLEPDAVLLLGDTNSCLSAIPAKRRKIPIFHMEAGNRCFDMRVPEESNRLIVDNMSDINLTYSSIARDYLLREGFAPDRVIKTGSPMYEVISHYREGIDNSTVLESLQLESKEYFLVSAHREENVDSDVNLNKLVASLNAIAARFGKPIIVSTHPRTQNKINEKSIKFHPLIRLLKPLGFKDYVKLQIEARVVLSDSGTITEEASILNFAALNLREAHERPEGMEEGAVMMVGVDLERIMQGITILEDQLTGDSRLLDCVADYDIANVSDKVVRIIHSYTDYVNRVVWRRY
ncbi:MULTISPECIES: non-hydrolyzing UDP-N-acetylglucosamine 2-epimerase [Yersinia]|uniref:UDP-N-acetylglucosamine 2-epimerase n=1 Tax=Yersinia intermedia TaxID=631 RepID=A0A0H5LV40_YERIN|nr:MULTISPECIES: UDP-N-acetylglucosamine 2-epimerase (non-hydrolyzing) [Yersinia]MCB5307771.1 UDP-N-acetylglucosamine 2-epimerase (non-hydrolyzing) [Yersinia massiliensis]CRY54910.1 UDP-N-acetylglucosamine 2-epimerase [Yersinia intermedia]